MHHTMIEISWLAMLLLATQDEIYSMELVSNEEQNLRCVNGDKSIRKTCEFSTAISSQFCFLFWNTASNLVFKKLIEAGS